jgi:hypothetical protein
LLLLGLVAMIAACGGGISTKEYATEIEGLAETMNGRLDQLDAEIEQNASLEALHSYARERVAARYAFAEGLEGLEPPADVEDLHTTALGIFRRLADAEALLAERVYELTTNIGVDAVWQSPEGVAARAADEEAVALCLSAQSDFDKTHLRRELGDVPWVPPEMKEVIIVTFGCVAEDR